MKAGSRVSVPAMNRATTSTVTLLVFTLLLASPGSAQEPAAQAQAEANVNASIVTTAPNQGASSRDIWFQEDLAAAEARSRRSRNALIWTSAVFGVGAILAGIGASQCQSITSVNNYDELLCNNAGDVLLPLGGTLAGLGGIGMITSGIILGVSNKRKRDIKRDMRRASYGRRLQWDIPSGGLVF